MAIGTGTDAAIGAADLTLVGGDPGGIADAIELARATMTVIRANLGWAFGYNLIAIPLAALGYLNPLFAGIAMSASSLIVVANSLRLRRFTPQGRRPVTGHGRLAELAGQRQGRGLRRGADRAAVGVGRRRRRGDPDPGADQGHPGRRPDARLHPQGRGGRRRGAHLPDHPQPEQHPGRADRRPQPRRPARHAHQARRRPAGDRVAACRSRHGTLTLSPLTDDVVLEDPAPFENSPEYSSPSSSGTPGRSPSRPLSPSRALPEPRAS